MLKLQAVLVHVCISPRLAVNKGGGPPLTREIAAPQHSETSDSMLMSKMRADSAFEAVVGHSL